MSPDAEEMVRRVEANQELPMGRCTLCLVATGKRAPHYARIEIEKTGFIITIQLPFCEACVEGILTMGDGERGSKAKRLRKTA